MYLSGCRHAEQAECRIGRPCNGRAIEPPLIRQRRITHRLHRERNIFSRVHNLALRFSSNRRRLTEWNHSQTRDHHYLLTQTRL